MATGRLPPMTYLSKDRHLEEPDAQKPEPRTRFSDLRGKPCRQRGSGEKEVEPDEVEGNGVARYELAYDQRDGLLADSLG